MPDTVGDALSSAQLRGGLAIGLAVAAVLLVSGLHRWAPVVLAAGAVIALGVTGAGAHDVGAFEVVLLAAATGAGAVGAVEVARVGTRPLAVVLVVSTVGIWAGVPDTELILAVGGAVIPGLVVFAARGAPLGLTWPGGIALVAPLAWAAVAGGAARPWAVVGGVLCLGLLLVPWAVRAAHAWAPWVLLAVHVVWVVVAARVVAPIGA